jgi:hypothetical protein
VHYKTLICLRRLEYKAHLGCFCKSISFFLRRVSLSRVHDKEERLLLLLIQLISPRDNQKTGEGVLFVPKKVFSENLHPEPGTESAADTCAAL